MIAPVPWLRGAGADRRIDRHLLDALYGMDIQTPDWMSLFINLLQAFRSYAVSVEENKAD